MNQSIFQFNKLPLKTRQQQVESTLEKHPDKIPVLCEIDISKSNLKPLDQIKYLVSSNMTVGGLTGAIRKKIDLDPSKALFVMNYTTKKCLPSGQLLEIAYQKYKDTDLFLKLLFVAENTFGQ